MLIIKFFSPERDKDLIQRPDTGFIAVNDSGIYAMKTEYKILPDQNAFFHDNKFIGVCTLKPLKLAYTFEQITPELISGSIAGLTGFSTYLPQYSIVTEFLGQRYCSIRGIEKIYFSDF